MLLAHCKIRRLSGSVSHDINAMGGSQFAKDGSSSVQTRETSPGTVMPRRSKN